LQHVLDASANGSIGSLCSHQKPFPSIETRINEGQNSKSDGKILYFELCQPLHIRLYTAFDRLKP